MCLQEREDDNILYIGGSKTVIYAFSLQSHEIIDIQTVGEDITCMDCFSQSDGSTLLCLGSEQGNIFIRKDWEELPKLYSLEPKIQGETKIMDLKFSNNGKLIVAISIEAGGMYHI